MQRDDEALGKDNLHSRTRFGPEGTAIRPRRGVGAISRGLSGAIPPDNALQVVFDRGRVAVGVLTDRGVIAEFRNEKSALISKPNPSTSIPTCWHPSGVRTVFYSTGGIVPARRDSTPG